jgi:hypothetical protein
VVKRSPPAGLAYAIHCLDPHGLDPAVYHVTLAVDRVDGKSLTEDEVEALRATLAPYHVPSKASAPAKKRKTG